MSRCATVKSLICAASLWFSGVAVAQYPTSSGVPIMTNGPNACDPPTEILPLSDYNGRFAKVAALLTRKIELKTVQKASPNKGVPVCGLDSRGKLAMFVRNESEPITFLSSGFQAGLAQAGNDDAAFGQGADGYGKRLGAALADSSSSEFFGTFLYPSIFEEDPRYFRRPHASTKTRVGNAMTHIFVARGDSGRRMFNYSEWFTVASSSALQNVYHPGNRRGFGPAATRAGVDLATDAGMNLIREFWPEIAKKLKLPLLRRGTVVYHSSQATH